MSGALRVMTAASAAGRRRLERLESRLESVLDRAVERRARVLVERVRRGGDAALAAAVAEHDGWAPGAAGLRLAPLPEDAGWTNLPPGFAAALEAAIAAVEAYARRQKPTGFTIEIEGVALGERIHPLARVGLYVPGGRASYPSTAVMSAVPARVAGVAEIVVATPPRTYLEQPALRYTLERLGVDEIWGMGGAHAVAALAFGTGSIRRVDLIAGPGNAWVTAAKRSVLGAVAIDGLMGPSEVVIVATEGADPELVAADLLAQAEHDPRAAAILLTPSRRLARETASAVERRLPDLETAETARASLSAYGGALVVADVGEAIALAERIAPEHLQLVGTDAEAASRSITRGGALFVGGATPEAFGDYLAGPSHVLPTCGTARFASPLGVETFLRRSHRIEVRDSRAADRMARQGEVFARVEGLPAHAASAALRKAAPGETEP